jgi:hypothetical protein
MRTSMMTLSAMAVIFAGGAMAAEPRGVQAYEFSDSYELYFPCAAEMLRVDSFVQGRGHVFETKNGTVHIVDNWTIHETLTGLSSGREWIGEGVSPYLGSVKVDQSGVTQWVSLIRHTPVVKGDPKFMYENRYKVTVNADGDLVVERLDVPFEDGFRCLPTK